VAYKVVSVSPTFGYYVRTPIDFLKERGCDVELFSQDKKEGLSKYLKDVDAIIVGLEKISRDIIASAPRLKIIAKHGAGVDNIDITAASERGIAVVTAKGANSDAVADLVIGLILSLARNIPYADKSIRGKKWERIVGIQVNNKVLGIIGLGNIGKKVASRSKGFDMQILAYDDIRDNEFARRVGIKYVNRDTVLSKADFVTIHLPLNEETRGMIAKPELGMMKPTAYLINTARGGIIDEESLYQCLKEGKIAGAALDVFMEEPPWKSPLLELDNIITTPHMAGYTHEALETTGMVCAESILAVLQGKACANVINPEIFKD
jgi:D-3-phosphoglycerate dehydrogenase